jgi:thioredoxin-like negative regulator of GroEL
MKNLSLILGVVFSSVVFAENRLKSEGFVDADFNRKAESPRVIVTVKTGFHINEKAPNKLFLQSGKPQAPSVQEKQKLVFDVDKGLTKFKGILRASIYVCDDALTVCENRQWSWDMGGKPVVGRGVRDGAEPPSLGKPKKEHGFYVDDLVVAKEECQKTKKPLLAEFSARWCPGCMRLEREVWSHPEMKKTLSKFVKVKLDADRFANKALMDQYGIRGIPATLILTCEGEELERFVDYQDRPAWKKSLEPFMKGKNVVTKSELVAKFEAGDPQAALILAERAAFSAQYDEALKYFAKVPDFESHLEYWWAAAGSLSEQQEKKPSSETKKALLRILDGALQRFPNRPSSLNWRAQRAELQDPQSEEGRKTLNELIVFCDELISDKAKMKDFIQSEFAGDYAGIETLKVYQAKAEAFEALGEKEKALQAWKDGVREWDRLGLKDEPSGQFFRFLTILKKAGEKERVNKFFETNLSKKPSDGELNRRYAKFLFDEGQFEKASQHAFRSVESSYDQNEIFAATLYAKALQKLGQKREARQFLLKYQTRADLPAHQKEEIEGLLAQTKE